MAHDVNNLLQAISAASELLAGRHDVSEEVRTKAGRIYSKAHEAAARLEQVAALVRPGSRVTAGQDPTRFVRDGLSFRHRDLMHLRVRVTLDATDGARVSADPASLQFLILHVLMEAERAFADRAGGHLHVRVGADHDDLCLIVTTDRPVPRPPGELEHEAEDGGGADVDEAARLAGRLGGVLTATPHDGGTQFVVRLPRV